MYVKLNGRCFFRYRVRRGADRLLCGLLLQRHHRLGFEVLLRVLHRYVAMDDL